jgi:hypothetical protein
VDWTTVATGELMQTLSTCGLDVPAGLPEEIVRRKEQVLEPLGHMLCGRRPDGGELDEDWGWAPIHALFLIGEMADARSLPSLAESIRLDDLMEGALLSDFLTEEVNGVFARFPEEAFDAIAELVLDTSLDEFHRLAPLDGLYGIASRCPQLRQKLTDLLIRLVRRDPDLGLATWALDRLARTDCPDARAIWKWAFSHRNVGFGESESTEYREAKRRHRPWKDPDLELDPMDHFDPKRLAQIARDYESIEAEWDDEGEDEAKRSRPVFGGSDQDLVYEMPPLPVQQRRRPKIGRNEPCPCGSGKKYKKCCRGTPKDPALWDDVDPASVAERPADRPTVYQIKVALVGTDPPVWRRLSVPADISLEDLHHVIQTAMGWGDEHLHLFDIQGRRYGAPAHGVERTSDEGRTRLSRVADAGEAFSYEYDFGDSWVHEVLVEKASQVGVAGVRCLDGARACPPEDCGGVRGYHEYLKILSDPNHPEHTPERLEWLGGDYDPEAFDLEQINKRFN